jgi:hypothetical protein
MRQPKAPRPLIIAQLRNINFSPYMLKILKQAAHHHARFCMTQPNLRDLIARQLLPAIVVAWVDRGAWTRSLC